MMNKIVLSTFFPLSFLILVKQKYMGLYVIVLHAGVNIQFAYKSNFSFKIAFSKKSYMKRNTLQERAHQCL